MQFEGAVIREQGVTFALVVVKQHVLSNSQQANEAIRSFGSVFPQMPVVLVAQDPSGRPTYFGRRDISQFMAKVPLRAIPWKRYTYN